MAVWSDRSVRPPSHRVRADRRSFDKWKGWHDDAQNSTGMNSPTRGKPKAHTRIPSEVVPAIVQLAIDMSMDDYRYLRARALVVD